MIGSNIVNRYQIESELGKGGMGVVYHAFDTMLEREVAIKVLSERGLAADSQLRLLEEARAAAGLSHPNIVTVYDIGEFDQGMFIVMELLQGTPLREQHSDDLELILDYFMQLCEALIHAHQKGVFHRDLKPENVILVGDQVKLMDFGLARSMASRLTADGLLSGTASYLSPEQALGMEVDGRTDLYSLGVMLYEMTAGRLPFTGDDALAVISQHLHAPVVPPRTYNKKISPGLNQLIMRLMNKTPADRPNSAEAVLLALKDLPKDDLVRDTSEDVILLQQIVQGRLVGRQTELKTLRQHWQQSQSGQAQLVLISGEPGVGKTRLANEMISYARLQGARLLRGGCYEYEATVPYLPVAEALRDWVHGQSPQQLEEKLRDYASELAKLAPEIEVKIGPLEPNPALSSDQERMRMFDHVARFFSDIAVDRGLLIFLDDLHWVDQGTLSLIRYLLRRLRNERVMILGGYREVELDRNHPLAAALVEWNRERLITRIQLGRLTKEDCGQLLASMFEQGQVSHEFTDAIYRETEGNPFFVEEVVKALIDSGQIFRENLEWQRSDELAIPQSIKEAIGRRLSRLSKESLAVLQYAAVLGKIFNFQELMMIYENGGGEIFERENYLINALDDGLNAQLIRGFEGESFSFTHDKIRETLYEDMNSIRRRRLHQKLAQAIEKEFVDQSVENHLPDLAYHYLQGGDLQKGMRYAIQAGEHARKLYANEEALRYYYQAAEAAETLNLDEELSSIFETIGDLHQAQGYSYEAVENYEEAISLVEREDQKARLKMKIGVSYANIGDVRGLDYLRVAEQELDPETQLEELASALSWIGRFYHYQAQHRQAITSFKSALDMIENTELYVVKCTLYAFLSGANQHLLEYEQSVKWAQECLSLGGKYDDPYWIAVGHEFLSEDLMFTGDWNGAIEHAIQDFKFGEKIGSLERMAWSKLCQAEPLYGLGRLKEALAIGQFGLELAEQISEHRLSILLLALLSKIAADLDDDKSAESYARQSIQIADDLNQVFMQCRSRFALIYLLVKHQEWEKALKLTNEGRELYLPTENVFARGEIEIIAPLVFLGLRQLTDAKNAAEEILELANNHKIIHYQGIALGLNGRILTELGELDSAAMNFRQAIEILSGLGSQLDLGRTYFHRGQLDVLQENLEEARENINKAKQIFIECSAKHDLKQAEELLTSIS